MSTTWHNIDRKGINLPRHEDNLLVESLRPKGDQGPLTEKHQ